LTRLGSRVDVLGIPKPEDLGEALRLGSSVADLTHEMAKLYFGEGVTLLPKLPKTAQVLVNPAEGGLKAVERRLQRWSSRPTWGPTLLEPGVRRSTKEPPAGTHG
tara:strand:+ start:640 stop:954 length:315 start_codon:yes stop_codon:yes gene_type:complete